MSDIYNYIDRDSLIKPHESWRDASSDGVITTSIAGLLEVYDRERCDSALMACIDLKSGCVLRRPGETALQSHDGYMAIAVWLLYTDNVTMARGLLVSGLLRLGYMNTAPIETGGLSWAERFKALMEPWLGRFPRIWITLLAASVKNRPVKLLCRAALTALTRLSPLRLEDSSGVQLKWLDLYAISLIGNQSHLRSFLVTIRSSGHSICELMSPTMWSIGHPVVDGYRAMELRVLTGGT